MPLSRYNPAFGGKKGSAAKAKKAMREFYAKKTGDPKKGDQVFYAKVAEHDNAQPTGLKKAMRDAEQKPRSEARRKALRARARARHRRRRSSQSAA